MIEIKIKYLDGATKLKRIQQGDWIDVYAYEDVILHQGESALVSLGFAMEFPAKYEAHLAPRSSTFKKWGVIQTNSVGVIDKDAKSEFSVKLSILSLKSSYFLSLSLANVPIALARPISDKIRSAIELSTESNPYSIL